MPGGSKMTTVRIHHMSTPAALTMANLEKQQTSPQLRAPYSCSRIKHVMWPFYGPPPHTVGREGRHSPQGRHTSGVSSTDYTMRGYQKHEPPHPPNTFNILSPLNFHVSHPSAVRTYLVGPARPSRLRLRQRPRRRSRGVGHPIPPLPGPGYPVGPRRRRREQGPLLDLTPRPHNVGEGRNNTRLGTGTRFALLWELAQGCSDRNARGDKGRVTKGG